MVNSVYQSTTNPNSAEQLMNVINQASFAMDDVVLYLDTHPCDSDALAYYQQVKDMRNQAVETYAAQYGPLTANQVNPGNYWSWITEKWPWEGGMN
ncbi:spore coat protein CotJB [Lachnospiraceae bacterium 62-35]